MVAIIGAITFSVVIILSVLIICGLPLGELTMGGQYKVFPKKIKNCFSNTIDFSNILCNSYFTDGWFFPVVVFKKSNQDNLHSYGCIPFVEYGHEFCVKE